MPGIEVVRSSEQNFAGLLLDFSGAASRTLSLAVPDPKQLANAVAEQLRALLRTPLVCLLVREADRFEVLAAAAENPALDVRTRAREQRRTLHFGGDIARRAIQAGELITVAVDPASHGLGDFVPAGILLATPFFTGDKAGAILVYPRPEGAFTAEEKGLLPVISSFAAMAISNAELYSAAKAQSQVLNESLTGLALELSSLVRGPEFAIQFLKRAAAILEATDAMLVTDQGNGVFFHSGSEERAPEFQSKFAKSVMAAIETPGDEVRSLPAGEVLGADGASDRHVLVARLSGATGELLGGLCFVSTAELKPEQRQLLQAIGRQAAVALENARFFKYSEAADQHWVEIFDAISDFVVVHDETGNVLRVNRALADFVGAPPQQLIGLNVAALLASGGAPLARGCSFCRAAGETSDEYIHPSLERAFLVSSSRVHGNAGERLQTVHVLKDITDRREAERRYHELFDNIQEGLFFSSPEGRFIEVNEALVRMLGYSSREELLHCDPSQDVFFTPEQHQACYSELEQQRALHNREAILRHKSGAPVHVLINAFAVPDAHGHILQYRGLMLDISGLKLYQSELQRERDFSGKILNNTQNLILVADTAGVITYANRRWQALGYGQEDVIGKAFESLIAGASAEALLEAFSAIRAGNQVDNLELQVFHGDRRVGQFSVNLSPMRDEQGKVNSIVVVMSDVTDAASLQSKLMHTEKMAAVGQLVSGVAHEVNNPLTAILGFADLLVQSREVPESARKDLRVILQEAQRTKQIVQNLLSFARQVPPQRKPIQLNPILKRTMELRSYDLQSRGVSLSQELRDDLPLVNGDAHQLQQVFLNILNNAYDAVKDCGRAGRIEISTASKDGVVEVSFRDNGCGISQPEHIFDPFFTTKQVGEGTGLGLSICYGIIKEHGGEIFCGNNPDNEGATFVVRLPAARAAASTSGLGQTTK